MSTDDSGTPSMLEQLFYEDLAGDREASAIAASGARLGMLVERKMAVLWLHKNAADFLFAEGLDPKLREYGTSVLEMVADALERLEHWEALNIDKETLQ